MRLPGAKAEDRTVRADRGAVAAGRDIVAQLIATGDRNTFFFGAYQPLDHAYIDPRPVLDRVRLERFKGRQWLDAAVDRFLVEKERGYFLLEAGLGLGKTAFLAHLVQQRGWICHFVEQAPGDAGIVPARKNLAAQVIRAYRLGGIAGPVIPDEAASRPDYLQYLLHEAAEKREQGEKIVVVVDGLDEAGARPGENVLGLPQVLPVGVYFVVSKRPVWVSLHVEPPTSFYPFSIRAQDKSNLADVRAYLESAAAWPAVACAISESEKSSAKGLTAERLADVLLEKSRGVWVYLHYVLSDIEEDHGAATQGQHRPLDLDALPNGLWRYYAHFWQAWKRDHADRWRRQDRTLLVTIGAAQEPVSLELLGTLSSLESDIAELPDRWHPFLAIDRGKETRYRLYHTSLADFVHGRVDQDDLLESERDFVEELARSTQQAHRRIGERLIDRWGGLEEGLPALRDADRLGDSLFNDYGLRHVIFHLFEGNADDLLTRALNRSYLITKSEQFGSHRSVLADLAIGIRAASRSRQSPALLRYAIVFASLKHRLASAGREDLIPLYALAGQVERAEEMASLLEPPWKRGVAQRAIVEFLTEVNIPQAIASAERVESLEFKAEAFVIILRAISHDTGQLPLVEMLLSSTLALIDKSTNAVWRAHKKLDLADLLAVLDSERARQLTNQALDLGHQIGDLQFRAEILRRVGSQLRRENLQGAVQNYEEALQALDQMGEGVVASKEAGRIARELSEVDLSIAEKQIDRISSPMLFVCGIAEVAAKRAMVDSGAAARLLERAEAVAERIGLGKAERNHWLEQAQIRIAWARAHFDLEKALKAFPSRSRRQNALQSIVADGLPTPPQALKVAADLDEEPRSYALRRLAILLVDEKTELAFEVIEAIPLPDAKAEALVEAAVKLGQAGSSHAPAAADLAIKAAMVRPRLLAALADGLSGSSGQLARRAAQLAVESFHSEINHKGVIEMLQLLATFYARNGNAPMALDLLRQAILRVPYEATPQWLTGCQATLIGQLYRENYDLGQAEFSKRNTPEMRALLLPDLSEIRARENIERGLEVAESIPADVWDSLETPLDLRKLEALAAVVIEAARQASPRTTELAFRLWTLEGSRALDLKCDTLAAVARLLFPVDVKPGVRLLKRVLHNFYGEPVPVGQALAELAEISIDNATSLLREAASIKDINQLDLTGLCREAARTLPDEVLDIARVKLRDWPVYQAIALASVAVFLDDHSRAEKLVDEALMLADVEEWPYYKVEVLILCAEARGNYDRVGALSLLKKATELSNTLQVHVWSGGTLARAARLLIELDRPAEALETIKGVIDRLRTAHEGSAIDVLEEMVAVLDLLPMESRRDVLASLLLAAVNFGEELLRRLNEFLPQFWRLSGDRPVPAILAMLEELDQVAETVREVLVA